MTERWTAADRARLAGQIERRMKELGIDTDAEMIRRGGPSAMTWRKIQRGHGDMAVPSYRKVDFALRWERGSCEAILAGGEPTPVEDRLTGGGDAFARRQAKLSTELARLREAVARVERAVEESAREADEEEEPERRRKLS